MQNEKQIIPKTSRILSIFHLFCYCREVSFKELGDLMPIARKTFERDVSLLQQAGLLDIRYSRMAKAYVPANGNCMVCSRPPSFPDSKPQRQYMEKIIRLATMMRTLKDDVDPTVWYRGKHSELSTRTMQRDFAELWALGYRIYRQGIIDYDGEHPIGSYYCYFPETAFGSGSYSAYCLETFNYVPL
jgi:hypothetical protein